MHNFSHILHLGTITESVYVKKSYWNAKKANCNFVTQWCLMLQSACGSCWAFSSVIFLSFVQQTVHVSWNICLSCYYAGVSVVYCMIFLLMLFFSLDCACRWTELKCILAGFFSDTITTWWCIKTDSGLVYHKRENRLIFEKKNENWWALKTQKETLKSLWRQCSHYQQSIVERICGRSETVKEWWAMKVMGKKMMCANVVNDEGYWLGGGR